MKVVEEPLTVATPRWLRYSVLVRPPVNVAESMDVVAEGGLLHRHARFGEQGENALVAGMI